MRQPAQGGKTASPLFSLTDEGADFRNRWRSLAGFAVWIVLSGVTMLLTVFGVEQRLHIAVVL